MKVTVILIWFVALTVLLAPPSLSTHTRGQPLKREFQTHL
jgi:hypothetical protein